MEYGLFQCIPLRFMDSTFENFQVDEYSENAFNQCVTYVKNYQDLTTKGAGLVLFGPSGWGKTRLATATVRAIEATKDRTAYFMEVSNLCQLMERWNRGELSESPISQCIRAGLLFLDGMDDESGRKYVETIIRQRYNDCRPMIVTTSLADFSEVSDMLGVHVSERLQAMCEQVVIGPEG